MAEIAGQVEIPNRALFKASEVCELVDVKPYVLRSWEAEFPELGIVKTPDGPRTYRRVDVERVVRIKHLLVVEGLTIAGVHRRFEDEESPVAADAPIEELIGRNARERLTAVKRGLRSILDLLGTNGADARRMTVASVRARPMAAPSKSRDARAKAAGRAKRASR